MVFRISKDKDAYVCWNGFTSQIGIETVGLNTELLKCLNWKNGDTVSLTKVDAMDAEWITVVPKTIKDWLIIEIQAEYLQDQILSQVQIVYDGMEIPLRVKDGSIVKVLVESTFPKTIGALKLNSGVQVAIVPLRKVEAFKKEFRCIPNYSGLEGYKVVVSENSLRGQVVQIDLLSIDKKDYESVYAIVEISQDLKGGQLVFSDGFWFLETDYQIFRFFFMIIDSNRVQGPIEPANTVKESISIVYQNDSSNSSDSGNCKDWKDELMGFLDSVLQSQEQVVLYNGMFLKISSSVTVQLKFSGSCLLLTRENIKLLDWKLEKEQDSQKVGLFYVSGTVSENRVSDHYDCDFISKIANCLKSNLKFTDNQSRLGVYSNFGFLIF